MVGEEGRKEGRMEGRKGGRKDWEDLCYGWMNNGKIDSCGSRGDECTFCLGECLLSVSDAKMYPNDLLGTFLIIDERWNQE